MSSPQQPGVLFTGNYRTKVGNPGVPGAPSVLDELAFPPASALAAQEAGVTEETNHGIVDTGAFGAATKVKTANFDPMKNFYDGAGVVGVDNDNPI